MTDAARGARWEDLGFALALALVALALSSWAYARALAHPPPERVAIGILADPHHVAMGAVYGSFAREAAEGGSWLVHNHQSSEPHAPALARPWDVAIGRLGALWGAEPRSLFHLDRYLAVPLFALGVMGLLCELFATRALRWGGLAAAMFGGSLYWIVLLLGPRGDLASALSTWLDAYHGRLSGLGFAYPALLLGVPHLVLELGFFAAGLACLLRAERRTSLRWALAAGLAVLLVACVRPYSAPVLLLAAAGVFAPHWRNRGAWWCLAASSLPVLPLLAHQALALRPGGIFAALQVEHPAPPPQEMALFCGLPVFLALWLLLPASRARRREASWNRGAAGAAVRRALLCWAAGSLALTHGGAIVPWEVEAFTPVPLLALVLGLFALETLRAPALRWVALVLHLVPTAFYAREVSLRLESPDSAYWITSGEARAFEWLEQSRRARLAADAPLDVLVCDAQLATLAPWLAGVRVLAGHPDHTVDFGAKLESQRAFFRHGGGLSVLSAWGANLVLLGPREMRLAAGDPPWFEERPRFLELAADCGDARVFRIAPP